MGLSALLTVALLIVAGVTIASGSTSQRVPSARESLAIQAAHVSTVPTLPSAAAIEAATHLSAAEITKLFPTLPGITTLFSGTAKSPRGIDTPADTNAPMGRIALGLHRGGQSSFPASEFVVYEEWTGYVDGKLVSVFAGEVPAHTNARSGKPKPAIRVYENAPINSASVRPPQLVGALVFGTTSGHASFAGRPDRGKVRIQLPGGSETRVDIAALVSH